MKNKAEQQDIEFFEKLIDLLAKYNAHISVDHNRILISVKDVTLYSAFYIGAETRKLDKTVEISLPIRKRTK